MFQAYVLHQSSGVSLLEPPARSPIFKYFPTLENDTCVMCVPPYESAEDYFVGWPAIEVKMKEFENETIQKALEKARSSLAKLRGEK
jgi:hypothetical protein